MLLAGQQGPTTAHPRSLTHPLTQVTLAADIIWPSRCSIKLRIRPLPESRMSAYLPRWACDTLRSWSTVSAAVKDLCVEASLLITLCPLTDRLPVVRGVSVSLREQPKTQMEIFVFSGTCVRVRGGGGGAGLGGKGFEGAVTDGRGPMLASSVSAINTPRQPFLYFCFRSPCWLRAHRELFARSLPQPLLSALILPGRRGARGGGH